MLTPLEIRVSGGVFLIAPFGTVPPAHRRVLAPTDNLRRLFASRSGVAQLRRIWPQVPGVGNHRTALTDAAMREQFEKAVRGGAVALVWVPQVAGAMPHALVRANAPGATPPDRGRPSVASLSVPDRIKAALIRSADHLGRDARAGAAAVRDAIQNLTGPQIALIVGAFAIVFVPVVGEVVLAIMLAYAYYEVGFHGTLAVIKLVRASAAAAGARSENDLDAAAKLYAEGFKELGKGFFAYILARLQVKAGGGRALGEAEAVVPRAARGARQVKAAPRAPKLSSPNAPPRPASSSLEGAKLDTHLRQLERYGSQGSKTLENGRIRYYGDIQPASKPGEMIGRRLVREWDPSSGATRTWHETLDAAGRVRQVRPQNGIDKVHRVFDAAGKYKGKW